MACKFRILKICFSASRFPPLRAGTITRLFGVAGMKLCGTVCLMYISFLYVCQIKKPKTTLETIVAYVNCSAFEVTSVVLYRPGLQQVTDAFFNEFCDLLERARKRVATYTVPLAIVGDFNIYVDRRRHWHQCTRKLLEIMEAQGLARGRVHRMQLL
jgi:hypothetical protein